MSGLTLLEKLWRPHRSMGLDVALDEALERDGVKSCCALTVRVGTNGSLEAPTLTTLTHYRVIFAGDRFDFRYDPYDDVKERIMVCWLAFGA